jgi:acetolactate synthase regulatory subunit
MKATLEIRMANAEGALERILGRLRQRCFAICSISADRSADHSFIDARISIESTRPIDTAVKQIAKLFDVMQVQVHYPVHYTEAALQHGYWQQQASGQAEVRLPV